jgi:hypothetical protein
MIDGPNVYAYVRDNPISFIDIRGLCRKDNETFIDCIDRTLSSMGVITVGGGLICAFVGGVVTDGSGTIPAGSFCAGVLASMMSLLAMYDCSESCNKPSTTNCNSNNILTMIDPGWIVHMI